jgi:plasmid stabilization system protein ParE
LPRRCRTCATFVVTSSSRAAAFGSHRTSRPASASAATTSPNLPGTLGRARDDLAPGLRSLAWRDYVILFRYVAGGVQVVRLLHGARDLPTLFTPGSEG